MNISPGFLRLSTSGKWVGVLKYKDADGKWRQKTHTMTSDRDESLALLALWRDGLSHEKAQANPRPSIQANEPPGDPPMATVEQAVRTCLDAQLSRGRIERSTHFMQMGVAERDIFPRLGRMPLASLTPAAVQQWVDVLCLRLSPGSSRIAYGILNKACAHMVIRGQLARNPLDSVEPPARARPARAYLPPHSAMLLEQAMDLRWGPADGRACASRLALYAGLRAGECCALRWRDVDLADGRLRVVASVGRAAGGPYLKPPKCAASTRELPIVSALAAALEARRGGPDTDPRHFVCGEGGAFASPRSLSTAFARLCEREGVVDNNGRRATFHALRHTFATNAVRAGVDIRTLADLMGHARADVTLNVYAATAEDALQVAAERLEGALVRASGPEHDHSGIRLTTPRARFILSN